ncbi:SPOSA6832_03080 [Sporobolomyces salmonicolor]|uniref:SPOSA6832_03080-mRNA-1:cds n=1 Tax=Sporidiobolus salmonicolor TaxID=5005 RepID=A0A0D6EN26_SPOSA|nr:SPOSA6832_03080 [Sporobolomyces salmonicolor]
MSGPPKLSFGLNKAALPRPAPKKASAQPKKSVFGGEDDDDDSPALSPSTSALLDSRPKVSTATLTKAQKAKQQAELELDSTVYEYDEVYDNMKAGEMAAVAERKKESGDRKPKYISRLMETAELRKQDRLRAEDKMIQREREREGDEFADKDAFVTPAYLAQQEEMRKAEAEEKKREEAEAGKRGGMTTFYKSYLETTSKAHDAAVAASQSKAPSSGASFTVVPPPKQKSDVELAREVEAQTGRKIEVNDDGEIVDKRQLMAGGLNIVAKPKMGPQGPPSVGGFALPISQRAPSKHEDAKTDSFLHPGISAAERARQSRERHSREVERQMVELEARRKREAEEELQQKVQKVAKRNDEDRVAALKRAAEERRRKREEEAQQKA